MSLIKYSACPACGNPNISPVLVAKDHTVSQESFPIWECQNCTLRFTQQVPDEAQIGSYYRSENYVSHTETKKGLINALYHFVRKKTLAGKLALVVKETGIEKGKLLDIGAGTGAFSSYMQKHGWEITALEPDAGVRKRASDLYGLEMQPSSTLPQLNGSAYHAITMWHVLEHVHNLHEYLDEIKRLLAPNGKGFIAVPNYTSYDAVHYGEHWAAYDVPRHLYHFSPAAMKALLKQHQLKLQKTEPMWYDSFYVSMLSEKYMNGASNNFAALVSGFRSNSAARTDPERCSSLIYIMSN
jgi:2-polyprenyl-3-methyl-5-hydroxy-6-metoxy-1,4-benzoquinol methylase